MEQVIDRCENKAHISAVQEAFNQTDSKPGKGKPLEPGKRNLEELRHVEA
jgi:hypothetical protein